MKKKFNCLVVALVIFAFCGGLGTYLFRPNYTFQCFDYQETGADHEHYSVRVSMLGSNHHGPSRFVSGSPYSVRVSVDFADDGPQAIFLERVRVCSSDKKRTIVDENEIPPKEPQGHHGGRNVTYYAVNDLELDYEDYVVVLSVVVELDGEATETEIELRIERDYSEYRCNYFLNLFRQ